MSVINFLSGDPSLAASWQGGVAPTANDVANFNAASGACSLTAAVNWGGIAASGYAAAFTSNGYAINTGASGWAVPTAITGTFNISNSTITNAGSIDLRGLAGKLTASATTKWVQTGGTEQAPNLHYGGTANNLWTFPFELAEGAWLKLQANTRWYFSARGNFTVNGTLDIQSYTLTLHLTSFSVGATGRVTGTAGILILEGANLSGHLENAVVSLIRIIDTATGNNSAFQSPVELATPDTATSRTHTFTGITRFYRDVSIIGPVLATAVFNVNIDNMEVYGSFSAVQNGSGNLTGFNGKVTVLGTADQTLDLRGIETTVNFAAHKQAGTLTVAGGSFTFIDESELGKLIFETGWAGTFQTNGHAIKTNGLDASQTIIGMLDLSNSTICNDGNCNMTGIFQNTLVTIGTVWIQRGGTIVSPNVWTNNAGGLKFDTLVFEKNSVTHLHNTMSAIVLNVQINGTLITDPNADINCFIQGNGNGSVTIGPGANICARYFSLESTAGFTTVLTGTTENIHCIRILFANGASACDCTFAGDVFYGQNDNNDPVHEPAFTNVTFRGNVEITAAGTIPVNMTFTDCRINGNLLAADNGTGRLRLYFKNTIAQAVDNQATIIVNEDDVLYCETFRAGRNSVLTGNGTLSSDFVLRSPDRSDVFSIANLATKATPFSLLLLDVPIYLETLRLYDAEGTFVVPKNGYESLILEAKENDSYFALTGEYRLENMQWIANNRLLTVDVTQKPVIHITGNIRSIRENDGRIRIVGSGTDRWVFHGATLQTVDLEPEHGHHVLHLLVNAKPSGDLVIGSPLVVYDYVSAAGKKLDALENLTVISRIRLFSRLHFVLEGTNRHFSQEGLCLENGKIPLRNNAVFYMKLSDAGERPVNPKWIERVTLRFLMMNPVSPHLHPPRKILIDDLLLRTDEIFSGEFETGNIFLSDGETFNGSLCSSEIEALRFEEPGLYHISFGVKLFGHKTPVTLRYEIYCDREV
ncbi:MAG: hypothetical protein FWC50_00385 [Planctomycetaceae bacterium]|nr:hypothetical protein [Planctomycetaceae bacterium]